MDPVHRELLRRQRRFLSRELLVSDSVVPFLFQEEILTEEQVETIESQPTERQKCLKLLDILPVRGPEAFRCFLRALDDFSWVRDRLLRELRAGPGAAESDPWTLPESSLLCVPSDRELSRLSRVLGPDWESVLLDLGVSASALYCCRADHALSVHEAALAALLLWRRSQGKKATVQRLVESLKAAGVHPSVLRDVLL